jgi:hypothetical protein
MRVAATILWIAKIGLILPKIFLLPSVWTVTHQCKDWELCSSKIGNDAVDKFISQSLKML